MTARALLGVADAAGRVHLSERDWLDGLCEALGHTRPKSRGTAGYTFRMTDAGVDVHEQIFRSDVLAPEHGVSLVRALSEGQLRRVFESSAVALTASSLFDGELPTSITDGWRAAGVLDALGLVATLDDGEGIVIGSAEAQRLDSRVSRQAALVVESIRTSLKLRRALGNQPLETAVEAIFSPDGSCEHVAENLRAKLVALKRAVRDREAARDAVETGHTDPTTVDAWAELCAGRYRLVDHFDRDGRRYVVLVAARRADPLRALTHIEERIASLCGSAWGNKQIAFELGMSESAVENHIGRIVSKLRLESRLELVRLYTQLEACTRREMTRTKSGTRHAVAAPDAPLPNAGGEKIWA